MGCVLDDREIRVACARYNSSVMIMLFKKRSPFHERGKMTIYK